MFCTDVAAVTPKGICYKGKYYSCKRAISEQWYHRAIVEGEWATQIRYELNHQPNIQLADSEEICRVINFTQFEGDELGRYHSRLEFLKEHKRSTRRNSRTYRNKRQI